MSEKQRQLKHLNFFRLEAARQRKMKKLFTAHDRCDHCSRVCACLGSAQLIKYGKTQNHPNPFKNSLKTTQNHRDPLNITTNYEMIILCCATIVFSIKRGIFLSHVCHQGFNKSHILWIGFGFYVLVTAR